MRIHLQRTARYLEMPVSLEIILPSRMGGQPMKSLYLLHDYGGNRMEWLVKTCLSQYVEGKNLAVIMPDGNNRYFANPPDGHLYGAYLARELPEYLEEIFPLSRKGKDRMIAGAGMGGYGALRAFLASPGIYCAVAAWNPHLDLDHLYGEGLSTDARYTFGEKDTWRESEHDLLWLAKQTWKDRENDAGTMLLQWQKGWRDGRLAWELADVCQATGRDVTAEELEWRADTKHVWEFYGEMLRRWLWGQEDGRTH